MFSQSRVNLVYALRKKPKPLSFFSRLPIDLIPEITNTWVTDDADAALLLEHVGSNPKPDAVKAMLDANPSLLLRASDVITPSGLLVQRVTAYECALGAGDYAMAALIASYFSQIPDGTAEKESQEQPYRPFIENMLNEKPYDFNCLIEIIKQSSDADITAEITHAIEYKSPLRTALEKLRKDFTPGMKTVGIHSSLVHLISALETFKREFDNLRNGNNYGKCNLFWRQVIGYIQRSLSACDRQVFARNILRLEYKEPLARYFEFEYVPGIFPITSGDDSHTGLGFDYACGFGEPLLYGHRSSPAAGMLLTSILQVKQQRLSELTRPAQQPKSSPSKLNQKRPASDKAKITPANKSRKR